MSHEPPGVEDVYGRAEQPALYAEINRLKAQVAELQLNLLEAAEQRLLAGTEIDRLRARVAELEQEHAELRQWHCPPVVPETLCETGKALECEIIGLRQEIKRVKAVKSCFEECVSKRSADKLARQFAEMEILAEQRAVRTAELEQENADLLSQGDDLSPPTGAMTEGPNE